jgi:hypothetical protein
MINQDIITAIKNLNSCLKVPDLKGAKATLNSNGSLYVITGGFCMVFQLVKNSKKWAFRVWHTNVGEIQERLQKISSYLIQCKLQYFADFIYDKTGLLVNGQWIDTIHMEWIDALLLKDYIEQHLNDKQKLVQLAQNFFTMSRTLVEHQISHGDLQHGNILVDSDGNIKLIDYDSVCIPEIEGKEELVTGLVGYQHPSRLKNATSAALKADYFSELIIYLSILAIADNPNLWDEYNISKSDTLLFSGEDFDNFKQSNIYKELSNKKYNDIKDLLSILVKYIAIPSYLDLNPFYTYLLPPTISFNANPQKISNGMSVILTWEVINAQKIHIDNGIGKVKSHIGSIVVQPTTNTIYQLTAVGLNGTSIKEVEVFVYPAPEITEFFVSQKEIIKGAQTKITWLTKNAIEVFLSINGVREKVKFIDTVDLKLDSDIEVELIVIGLLNKEIRKTEKILVHEPAQILSFSVNQYDFLDKDTITVYFDVANASKVYLSGTSIVNKQDVTNSTEFTITALSQNNSVQIYSLEVFDKINHALLPQTISVNVYPQPSIISFSASKDKILTGDEIDLLWNVLNYSKIMLVVEGQTIDVTNMTSYKLKPSNSANYKLVVTSLANLKQIESQLIVQVLQYVELNFYPNKTNTVQTLPITLQWNVKHATEIYIQSRTNALTSEYGDRIDVAKMKNLIVYPERTILYKMIAKNDLNQSEKEILINVFELPKITPISLPELPPLALYLPPSLNFTDETYKPKLRKSMEDNKWYYNLFAWQMKSISQELSVLFDNFNKKIYNILKIKENGI